MQAQSRACIDFGETYAHSIHCYCLAWRREGVLHLAWFSQLLFQTFFCSFT